MVNEIKKQMQTYFVGKEETVENVLVCLLAGGHILLEDVPGVGKTTLARILAKSVDCDFGRIQFTPDTLPSDVVGTEIYNMKTGEFDSRKGAIMHQIILADEINRTSPKTQSSLLEAMAEGQVTVGEVKYDLPEPFMVIATQNPVDFMGTFPLPEAQMDRFMMRISLGYPTREEEIRLAKNHIEGKTVNNISSICTVEELLKIKANVGQVYISDGIIEYAQEIVDLTRKEEAFAIGASPRAMLSLLSAAQAKAFLNGRDFVKPDDVKSLVVPVFNHRIKLTAEAKMRKESIEKLLVSIAVKATIPMK